MTNENLVLTTNFPLEMKQKPHWLLWKLIHKDGKPKPDKVPFSPKTLSDCNPTSLDETTTLENAVRVWECSPNLFKGLGFSLQGGIVCIDLDHCLDEAGEPLPWAQTILDRLPASYTEISQSGKGLHWFGRGEVHGTRNKFKLGDGQTVEIYQQGRYIAMTGRLLGEAPCELADANETLNSLYREWEALDAKPEFKPASGVTNYLVPASDITESELLKKMFAASNGASIQALWNGDTSQHNGDDSSADLALMNHLAFWTNGDMAKMDALFSQSALGQREKWQRPDYRKRTIDKAMATFSNGYESSPSAVASPRKQNVWPKPRELQASLLPVEPFDMALLPKQVRGWVQDEAHRMQAPADFIAATVMVILSSIIGRQLAIRPKRLDDWTVVPNLWGMIIGRPSTLKSPSIQSALKALNRLEVIEDKRYQKALSEYESIVQVGKIRQEKKRKDLSRKQSFDLIAEAKQWRHENELPPPPVRRRFITNDVTIAKAGALLADSPNGFLVFRDELSGFLKKLDKDGHEEDRAFYLECWNGSGTYTFDRIERGTITIEGTCLSVFGGIQPAVIAYWLNQANYQTSSDDGFIQRFQLMVWPDELSEYIHVDEAPNVEAKAAYYKLVEDLSKIDPYVVGATRVEDDLSYLHFSSEAQPIFDQWFTEHRNGLSSEERDSLSSHFAKYLSLIPSLALVCHLANEQRGPVGKEALLQALAWSDYLTSHARRAYMAANLMHVSTAQKILKQILKKKLPSPFTARTLERKHWAGVTKETIPYALDELEEAGYLRRETKRGPHRPADEWVINPCVLKEG